MTKIYKSSIVIRGVSEQKAVKERTEKMDKIKNNITKLYVALVGATLWEIIRNSNWLLRLKGIMIEIQTVHANDPAGLMWRVAVTIFALAILNWGVSSLQKKFSWPVLFIILAVILWLLFVGVVILAAIAVSMGGNPTTLIQLIKAVTLFWLKN